MQIYFSAFNFGESKLNISNAHSLMQVILPFQHRTNYSWYSIGIRFL